jgi:hypothetical protein
LQILECENSETYVAAVESVLDLVEAAGCMAMASDVSNKQRLVDGLCYFYAVARAAVVTEQ